MELHNSKLFCKALSEGVLKPARCSGAEELTDVQYAALRYIRLHPQISLYEFAEGLEISSPAATKLADRLAERKWVQRVNHPTDRRRWVLKLTPLGNRVWEKVVAREEQLMEELMADFGDDDRKRFSQVLTKFVRKVALEHTAKEHICLKCGTAHQHDCILQDFE